VAWAWASRRKRSTDRVTEDKRSGIRSDPNRADDEEYIVRLVGLPERYAD